MERRGFFESVIGAMLAVYLALWPSKAKGGIKPEEFSACRRNHFYPIPEGYVCCGWNVVTDPNGTIQKYTVHLKKA